MVYLEIKIFQQLFLLDLPISVSIYVAHKLRYLKVCDWSFPSNPTKNILNYLAYSLLIKKSFLVLIVLVKDRLSSLVQFIQIRFVMT